MWRVKPRHERGAPAWEQSFKVGKTPGWERMDRKVRQALGRGDVVTGSFRHGKASGTARRDLEETREGVGTTQKHGAG
jgi:hypothetical protein